MKVYQASDVDPLKTVLLGNWFLPEYFDSIAIDKIREPLKRIAHETQEDFDNIKCILSEHGVKVIQVDSPSEKFSTGIKHHAPLGIRNSMHVFGDTLYRFSEMPWDDAILEAVKPDKYTDLYSLIVKEHKEAIGDCLPYSFQKWQELAGPDWPDFRDYCLGNYTPKTEYIAKELAEFAETLEYDYGLQIPDGCNIILTDTKVFVDSHEYYNFTAVYKKHIDLPREWIDINLRAGHTDGCFKFLNNDTAIGIKDVVDYNLVGVKHLIELPEENYQSKVVEWRNFKSQVNGKWWLPGEENNNEFTHFVEQYLNHLVGYVDETVFDVNVLPLDSANVFTATRDKKYIDMYKKHGINAIPVPFRHKWFHDSGLHCITLCLERM